MNENKKDIQRECEHAYQLYKTIVSDDTTEYIKTFICSKCQEECTRRYQRAGARQVPAVVM
jgi:superfamily II helicase